MSNPTAADCHTLVDKLDSPTVIKPTDPNQAPIPPTTDAKPPSDAVKDTVTDDETEKVQSDDAADAENSSTEIALPKPAPSLFAQISHNPSRIVPASNAPPLLGTVQSTQPLPTVYPPRRPNIFRARQKHLRYPDSAYTPVNANTRELEAADGFEDPDMESFQADVKKKMEEKTAAFLSKMSQHNWSKRRVEDLGEIFAIED